MGVEISSAEPMTSDLDIYRAANLLIKQHGDETAIHAAMRADEILVPQSLPADRGEWRARRDSNPRPQDSEFQNRARNGFISQCVNERDHRLATA